MRLSAQAAPVGKRLGAYAAAIAHATVLLFAADCTVAVAVHTYRTVQRRDKTAQGKLVWWAKGVGLQVSGGGKARAFWRGTGQANAHMAAVDFGEVGCGDSVNARNNTLPLPSSSHTLPPARPTQLVRCSATCLFVSLASTHRSLPALYPSVTTLLTCCPCPHVNSLLSHVAAGVSVAPLSIPVGTHMLLCSHRRRASTPRHTQVLRCSATWVLVSLGGAGGSLAAPGRGTNVGYIVTEVVASIVLGGVVARALAD